MIGGDTPHERVDELGDDFEKLFREILTSRPMFAIAIID